MNLRLGQREGRLIDLREVPLARNELRGAIDIPAEAVEGAAKLTDATVFGAQGATAVQADIRQRLDVAGVGAHDEPLVIGNVVHDVIAGFGDLVDAAHELPDLAPYLLDLAVMEVAGDEALDIEGLAAEILVDAVTQHRGHRARIVVEELLHAGGGRHRRLRLVGCSLRRNLKVGHLCSS